VNHSALISSTFCHLCKDLPKIDSSKAISSISSKLTKFIMILLILIFIPSVKSLFLTNEKTNKNISPPKYNRKTTGF